TVAQSILNHKSFHVRERRECPCSRKRMSSTFAASRTRWPVCRSRGTCWNTQDRPHTQRFVPVLARIRPSLNVPDSSRSRQYFHPNPPSSATLQDRSDDSAAPARWSWKRRTKSLPGPNILHGVFALFPSWHP